MKTGMLTEIDMPTYQKQILYIIVNGYCDKKHLLTAQYHIVGHSLNEITTAVLNLVGLPQDWAIKTEVKRIKATAGVCSNNNNGQFLCEAFTVPNWYETLWLQPCQYV